MMNFLVVMESMQKCGISKKLLQMLFMDKLKSGPNDYFNHNCYVN